MITEEELDYLVDGAIRFHTEAGFPLIENAKEYYRNLHDIDGFFSIVNVDKGFIVGHVAPAFLQPSELICSELAWYVEPEYRKTSVGIKLLKAYEKKAKEMGADQVSMVCIEALTPEALSKMYVKLGYNVAETHFIKDL